VIFHCGVRNRSVGDAPLSFHAVDWLTVEFSDANNFSSPEIIRRITRVLSNVIGGVIATSNEQHRDQLPHRI
jgi:hypothetical protein